MQVLFKSVNHSQSLYQFLYPCYQDIMQQLSHVKGGMFDGTDMKVQLSKYDSENFRKTKNTIKLGV